MSGCRGRGFHPVAPRALGLHQRGIVQSGRFLFQRLRAERKRIADEQGVPAFVVLHDATLRAIARVRPVEASLTQVSTGVYSGTLTVTLSTPAAFNR